MEIYLKDFTKIQKILLGITYHKIHILRTLEVNDYLAKNHDSVVL